MGKTLDIGYGINVIDTHYMQGDIAALYLLKHNDKAVIIETGTKHSVPAIKAALESNKLVFDDVLYIIPTHIHLDHAAGAGELMQLCQNAKLVIQPNGEPHMINPEKLIAGTIAVYGREKFKQLYGDIKPIEPERIITADDGFKLNFNDRVLEFINTPGHARHHFCVWDVLSQSMFTGDTFGISYPEFNTEKEVFIFPTTTPVQFEPEQMIKSIDRIMQYNPQRMCLTHFGAIKPTQEVLNQLKTCIAYFVNIAKQYYPQPNFENKIENAMMDYLLEQLNLRKIKNLDFCKEKLKNDVNLNTQGLIVWQKRLAKLAH